MDKSDRDRIDQCCEKIISEINITLLWPRLIEFGVFNEDDANVPNWEEANLENADTIRDILLTIKTRGPYAFANFIRSLRATGHIGAMNILGYSDNNIDVSTNNDTAHGITPMEVENSISSTKSGTLDIPGEEDEFYKNLQKTKEPLKINVRKAEKFLDCRHIADKNRCYPMRSNPRGLVLIITIINYMIRSKRAAAEHDETNLRKLFEDMGFEVTTRRDLTGAEIKGEVKAFAQRKEFSKVSSSFVIISAHGCETRKQDGTIGTEIQGVDYALSTAEKIWCSDLVDFFTADKCRPLSGKPKVFIFQACRGEKFQEEVIRTAADGSSQETERIYSDILIAHSTMPKYRAFRDTINGSWYIQILCEVFMNYACEMHLVDLFALVDRRLKRLRSATNQSQTSTFTSIGFNMHCYLHPGLFEDD